MNIELAEGRRRKSAGLHNAQKALPFGGSRFIEEIRAVARNISQEKGSVTIDDLFEHFIAKGHDIALELGPAIGSIFRAKGFGAIGFVESRRPSNHARIIRKWWWACE